MYGTIATMRLKPGSQPALESLMEEWGRDFKPKVKGAVGGYVLRPDDRPNEAIVVAIFEDRAAYRANAESPEQDRWYRRMREHLEADPSWNDGEITQTA
jgi:heme-degrading monooxygenase HmoA